jgi:copper chaperone CopZ
MHCASCVARITSTLEQISGVESVTVTLEPPQAKVKSQQQPTTEQVLEALRRAGNYSLSGSKTGKSIDVPVEQKSRLAVYKPLLLVLAFVGGGTLLLSVRDGHWHVASLMSDFMGLFFVTFAFFKLLNLREFADAFQSYDLIGGRHRHYALAYPFVELGLGICFLLQVLPFITNLITFAVMSVGAWGVAISLMKRNQIRCACLGTVFELPMSTVTLIEDVGMAVMAAAMLFRLP